MDFLLGRTVPPGQCFLSKVSRKGKSSGKMTSYYGRMGFVGKEKEVLND